MGYRVSKKALVSMERNMKTKLPNPGGHFLEKVTGGDPFRSHFSNFLSALACVFHMFRLL